jgi:hypothetical protein
MFVGKARSLPYIGAPEGLERFAEDKQLFLTFVNYWCKKFLKRWSQDDIDDIDNLEKLNNDDNFDFEMFNQNQVNKLERLSLAKFLPSSKICE